MTREEWRMRAIKHGVELKKVKDTLKECREWLDGMIEVMNNESADYNKSRPIGLFENAMQRLLIKIDEVLK